MPKKSIDTIAGGAEPPTTCTSELDIDVPDSPTTQIASIDVERVTSPLIIAAAKTSIPISVDTKLSELGMLPLSAVAAGSKFHVLVKYRAIDSFSLLRFVLVFSSVCSC
jgi:hypothetical protein